MASINITITKDAYDFLKSVKGGKSFSQTILSFSKDNRSLLRYAGCFKGIEHIKNIRDEINEDWKNRN